LNNDRFFVGLLQEEKAAWREISIYTADRAWRHARVWHFAAMDGAHLENKSCLTSFGPLRRMEW
jgi:hypothetical protein